MINVSITDYTTLLAFWLGFTRIVCIVFQIPIFDNNSIPVLVKILTSVILTYCFFPLIQSTLVSEIMAVGADHFWLLTISHAIIGLIIGYLVKMIINLFIASGTLMTQQIGFTSVSYFDPTADQRVGPFEKMIQWTLIIMILSTGALIPMFKGILESFASISTMSWGKFANAHIFYLDFFKQVFKSAFLLATPILFTNLLLNLVLGIIARTVPQMNVLMVSFVVNIGIGLLVFLAISEEYFHMAYKLYIEKLGNWFQFIT
jgi:flagellar biosynthetic protein FliR